jgi:hypothetical protein
VQGYTAPSGTYVQPHQQTKPNNTQRDNYSATGNANKPALLNCTVIRIFDRATKNPPGMHRRA